MTALDHARGHGLLSPDQIRDIRARAKKGRNRWHQGNLQDLGDEFGVSSSLIGMIIRGKAYEWVT